MMIVEKSKWLDLHVLVEKNKIKQKKVRQYNG